MTVPPRKTGGLGVQLLGSVLSDHSGGDPPGVVPPKPAKAPASGTEAVWRGQWAVSRGRLVLLAGLLALFVLGAVGRDRPAVFGGVLALAIASAGLAALAVRVRRHSWVPATAGAVDGLAASALVYASGGPGSPLDVLVPVAILALVAQPVPLVALGIAILDTWLYLVVVVTHPGYVPGQHFGPLATRLFLDVLLGVCAYVGAGAALWRGRAANPERRASSEAEQLRRSVLGRANLIAMLSHDLRTPLTSVKGFAQLLLRDQTASDTTQRYASVILSEANRAIRTISDAVDLARVQSGHGELRLETVDIRPILESAVKALEHHDPDGRVQVSIPGPLPLVRTDPSKVERIMVNLISYALRYSQGGAPIEVGAAGDVAGVLVWVLDKGRGIPPERFAHVFDLETDDSQGEGEFNASGLGLYISKQLVEAHGGQMWVESAEGRGSRFVFRLPS